MNGFALRAIVVLGFVVFGSLASALASSQRPSRFGFEENRGQVDDSVRFLARVGDATLYLTECEVVVAFDGLCPGAGRAVLRWEVLGSTPAKVIEGLEPLDGEVRYFKGNDPARWVVGVRRFARVRYRSIRPGVDLIFREDQSGNLEYDFEVGPQADPSELSLRFEGADDLAIDSRGDLVVRIAGRELRQHRPVVYQEASAGVALVAASFALRGAFEIGFDLGRFDPALPLVIDPSFSTYLGGSDEDRVTTVTRGLQGGATYVAGTTRSLDFPVVQSLKAAPTGDLDGFVALLWPDNTQYAFVSYFGGSGDDRADDVVINRRCGWCSSVYVVGTTSSSDFPRLGSPVPYAGGASDGFVMHLYTTSAPPEIINSHLIGGSGADWVNGAEIEDIQGLGLYVVGGTTSPDLPLINAFQGYAGGTDGFIYHCCGPIRDFLTYVGGSGDDELHGISGEYEPTYYQNEPVIVGTTSSTDFPTVNPLQAVYGGGAHDAIVAAIAGDDSGLTFATYLGGSGDDRGSEIYSYWGYGEAFVSGTTDSIDFPTFAPIQPALGGGTDTFVAAYLRKGAGFRFSTYLGGSLDDTGGGIALLYRGASEPHWVLVAGSTRSSDFPTKFALQPTCASCPVAADAFFARLDRSGTELLCSSFIGGADAEAGFVDIDTAASGLGWLLGGTTASRDFPLAAPTQTSYGGGASDGFVQQIDCADITPLTAGNTLMGVARAGHTAIEWSWSAAPRSLGHWLRSDLVKGGTFPTVVAREETGATTLTIPTPAESQVLYQLSGVNCCGQGP